MKKIQLVLVAIISLITLKATANNLSISNVSAPSSTSIQFDISWDNSWNVAPLNWDAVWIIVKTQVCDGTSNPWAHADVSTVSGNHSVGGGVLQVDAVADGKGVFIRRSGFGAGSIASSTVTLTLSNSYTVASTNYEVIGVEMVNVPQGSFNLGDGSTVNATHSTASFGTANTAAVYTVSNENAIALDGLRNDKAGDANITAHAAIIAGFPKGYNAFYCMKYEISQQQYVTFLNLIDYASQQSRTATAPSSAVGTAALATVSGDNRNAIEIKTPGVAFSTPAVYGNDLNGNNIYDEASDGGNIACNYLGWDDLKAYLDWAALRPMTEMEYEKASRGSSSSLLNEYPWGSTTMNQAISNSLASGGSSSEVSSSSADGLCASNAGASSTLGPLRCGYAATAATSRTGAGASYWGIMDLGGNLFEQMFQCGWWTGATRTAVPTFTGTLGDGALDITGNANAANWGAVALTIVRGGSWEGTNQRVQTSDRFYVNSTAQNATRIRRTGGRGVR
ncbi:MAG: SUMF1/EgtB/PvdO family nonheme iron enzyme [Bacteroidota bacterium]